MKRRALGKARGSRKGNRLGVSVAFDRPQLDRINVYAQRQKLSVGAAIRRLVDMGFKASNGMAQP